MLPPPTCSVVPVRNGLVKAGSATAEIARSGKQRPFDPAVRPEW
jgi:hypothetical protein